MFKKKESYDTYIFNKDTKQIIAIIEGDNASKYKCIINKDYSIAVIKTGTVCIKQYDDCNKLFFDIVKDNVYRIEDYRKV